MIRPIERRRQGPTSSAYADVQVELTQLTFRRLTNTVILGGVGMVGTVSLLAYHYGNRLLWAFAATMLVASAARLTASVAFSLRGDAPLTPASARVWQWRYGLATGVYCCILAVCTSYVFSLNDEVGRTLSLIGSFAISAGLSGRVGMPPWFVRFCDYVLLGSLALSILISPLGLLRIGALLIVMLCVSHYESAQNKFDILVEELRLRRKFHDLAEQDTLTGLANRRRFQEHLATACLAEQPFAVLFLDLDRFKQVNDVHGHAAGDALLQAVAQRLRSTVRKTDMLARLGGDEFAILQAPVATEESAQELAKRILSALSAPFEIDGEIVQIGASIGVQLSQPGDKDASSLLNRADLALYAVKEAGGGHFRFAEL